MGNDQVRTLHFPMCRYNGAIEGYQGIYKGSECVMCHRSIVSCTSIHVLRSTSYVVRVCYAAGFVRNVLCEYVFMRWVECFSPVLQNALQAQAGYRVRGTGVCFARESSL